VNSEWSESKLNRWRAYWATACRWDQFSFDIGQQLYIRHPQEALNKILYIDSDSLLSENIYAFLSIHKKTNSKLQTPVCWCFMLLRSSRHSFWALRSIIEAGILLYIPKEGCFQCYQAFHDKGPLLQNFSYLYNRKAIRFYSIFLRPRYLSIAKFRNWPDDVMFSRHS